MINIYCFEKFYELNNDLHEFYVNVLLVSSNRDGHQLIVG